jgi:hypothetical protein
MHSAGKLTRQRPYRGTRSSPGTRLNKISNGLGLSQIHFVVQKSPTRELARLGQAGTEFCATRH